MEQKIILIILYQRPYPTTQVNFGVGERWGLLTTRCLLLKDGLTLVGKRPCLFPSN